MEHHADVHTYVLFSGGIEHPKTEFTCGINTYRVHPIIMKGNCAEEVFDNITEKLRHGLSLTEDDLVPLALCPLMGGDIPQKERFHRAFKIVQDAGDSIPDLNIIEAVLYTMATKFLNSEELNNLKEEIKMTALGLAIYNDGKNDGILEGISQGISQTSAKNARNLFTNDISFDLVKKSITGLSDEALKEIYNEVMAEKKKSSSNKSKEITAELKTE